MQKLPMLLTPLIILSLIFGAVGCASWEPPPPTLTDIDFSQTDFNLDGNNITDSSWGAATIVYESDDEIMFINLTINGQWVVQNLPLMPVGKEIVLDFDLGVENGINVTQLEYACEITTDLLETMPSDFQTATVADRSAVMYSGIIGANATFSLPPVVLIGWLPADFAYHDEDDIFNQPCGIRECCPVAVSNTLKFLKKKHNLTIDDDKINIETMKLATAWVNLGLDYYISPWNWYDYKKEHMKNHNYPIETTIYDENDLDKIIGEIRRGQGVELQVPGHTATVVGIIKLLNGNYIFMVAQDTNQGPSNNGGEVIQPSIYFPDTKKFAGGYEINGKNLSKIIVECPT